MPLFSPERLSPEVSELLSPDRYISRSDPTLLAHQHRSDRLQSVPEYRAIQRTMATRRMPGEVDFMTPEGIRDTFANTQGIDETHRLLAPRLQEMMHYPDSHQKLMAGIDRATQDDTDREFKLADKNNGTMQCDVAIVGSGPHGAAAALNIRETYPTLNILLIEAGDQLGGQWRNNGPNPSFYMNSRVRRADRRLSPTPRTPGNINPLGRYAVMELSDHVKGNYATNIEMGDLTAVNGYLAATHTLVGTRASVVEQNEYSASMTLQTNDGRLASLNAGVIIDATGIRQRSTLVPDLSHANNPNYYNSADLYRHFGNAAGNVNHRPLEAFDDKDVIAIGGGDSLLTGLEALLGNLPAETYGQYGPGRYRPRYITWVGAPGETAGTIDDCLRSRYKNGIVQALPKSGRDEGALINPIKSRAESISVSSFGSYGARVELEGGRSRDLRGDIIIDCTNRPQSRTGLSVVDFRDRYRESVFDRYASFRRIGPGAGLELPQSTLDTIAKLGIDENTVALWALMRETDIISMQAGRTASTQAVRTAIGNRR